MDEVYEFVANPINLPQWAQELGTGVERAGGEWLVETAGGKVSLRFAEHNNFGVVDHTVRVKPGVEVYVPMRVIRNGGGSEVLLTLQQSGGMTDEEFARDIAQVVSDLATLKDILEKQS